MVNRVQIGRQSRNTIAPSVDSASGAFRWGEPSLVIPPVLEREATTLNRVASNGQLTLLQETVGQRLLGHAKFPTICEAGSRLLHGHFLGRHPIRRVSGRLVQSSDGAFQKTGESPAIIAVPAKLKLVWFELAPRHGPGLERLGNSYQWRCDESADESSASNETASGERAVGQPDTGRAVLAAANEERKPEVLLC